MLIDFIIEHELLVNIISMVILIFSLLFTYVDRIKIIKMLMYSLFFSAYFVLFMSVLLNGLTKGF